MFLFRVVMVEVIRWYLLGGGFKTVSFICEWGWLEGWVYLRLFIGVFVMLVIG